MEYLPSKTFKYAKIIVKVAYFMKKGEAVISVPKSLFFGSSVLQETPLRSLMDDLQHDRTLLVIALLYEKSQPNSFWKPYLGIVP